MLLILSYSSSCKWPLTPTPDSSLSGSMVYQIGQWCSRYFGLFWVPFLGCVCSAFFRKTFTHNKEECHYMGKAIFPHSGARLTTFFFLKVMCFPLWMHTEGTGVAGGCELPSVNEWWELSTCPLQHSEPSYTEPSPQPPNWVFILSILNAVFFFCLVNLIFFH